MHGPTQRLANLRDVGGLPAAGGRRVREGVLLRSDAPQPGDVPPEDVAWPPTLVVDLRSPQEVGEAHPLVGKAEVRSIPLGADARIDRVAQAHPDLPSLYAALVSRGAPRIVEAVTAIADAEGPTLVHCAAGKDRTGIVVAVALAAVGVDHDAVVTDYGRTNEHMPAVIARFRADPAATDVLGRLLDEHPGLFVAPVAAMDEVLRDLQAQPGGVRGWLVAEGLEAAALDRLAQRLLAPGA